MLMTASEAAAEHLVLVLIVEVRLEEHCWLQTCMERPSTGATVTTASFRTNTTGSDNSPRFHMAVVVDAELPQSKSFRFDQEKEKN